MNDYLLTILHDGDCPICRLDMEDLQARSHAGLLQFRGICQLPVSR